MRQNGVRSNVRFPTGASGMKKGGSAKKKKKHEDDELKELAESFNSGKLHEKLSKVQLELIEGLKKLAIYGSKSDKSRMLPRFIEQLKTHISPDKRRTAFDNLANVGILSYDEPTELIKSEIPRIFQIVSLARFKCTFPL